MEEVKTLQKIDWISMAKGFGILEVIAVHTVHNFNLPSYVVSVADAGRYCVQLFFIISAYLTFRSFGKYNITTYKDYFLFVIHKIVRFIPVLYIVSIYCFISYCVKNGMPNFTDKIWLDLFFSVSFLNGFSVEHINPWINWYIGTFVIFILVTPPV